MAAPWSTRMMFIVDRPGPSLDSRSTDDYCIVFIASNTFASELDLPAKERVIEGVKAILREDRNPEWIRIPVSL